MTAWPIALATRAVRPIGATVGLAALLLAIAVAYRALPTDLTTVSPDLAVLAFAGCAAVLALLTLAGDSTAGPDVHVPQFDEASPRNPPITTAEVDALLERPSLGEGDHRSAWVERSRLRRRVRRTSIAVLSDRHDVSGTEAATIVRSGEWTDDPRARSFLATDVPLPLDLRLADWLHGRRYRRGLEAAVAEIEHIDAGDPTVAIPDLDAVPDNYDVRGALR